MRHLGGSARFGLCSQSANDFLSTTPIHCQTHELAVGVSDLPEPLVFADGVTGKAYGVEGRRRREAREMAEYMSGFLAGVLVGALSLWLHHSCGPRIRTHPQATRAKLREKSCDAAEPRWSGSA